ncbi:MAG: PAS domain S-box protein [Balneolaceae bacterium]|nr:PAS domain S-box protein [Balneolaceae bacterium]MCH8548042.1 PAS domain S-box protein [Balneolaceae bacterium]
MKFTPLRISVIYLVFAVIWITTTDQIIEWIVSDPAMITRLQTFKGLFYVFLTAFGLYWMIRTYEKSISKSERELRGQKERLNIALNAAEMGIWEYFPENDSYLASENHNMLFGYPEEYDLKMQDVLNRIHEDDLPLFMKKTDEALDEKSEFDVQYRVRLPDQEGNRWYWTKARPSIHGEITFTGVTIDITERKKLEEQLYLEKERFEKLFDKIPVLIDIFNPQLEIFQVNREFEEVLGWNNTDLGHNDLLELCYPDPDYRKRVKSEMTSPSGTWREYTLTTKDGDQRDQLWTNIRLSDETIVGIGYDITERKKLQDKMEMEREELQTIFDSMPVFINLHDKEDGIARVNRFFEERLGYSNESIESSDLLKLITTRESYHEAKKHISQADGSWKDFELLTSEGKRLNSTWTNIQISESKSLGICLDITERKEMEERLKLTTTSANVGLWEWMPQTGETKFDEVWANLVGYTLEELEPVSIETWNMLLHPDDHGKFEKAVEDYFEGRNDVYECEVRMRHRHGHWVWILDRGRAVDWDQDGNPTRLVGTHIDISNRIAYEESLKYQASLLSSVTDGVISINHEDEIVSWNSAAERMYGWKKEEVEGEKITNILKTEFGEGETRDSSIEKLVSDGSWQGEVVQYTKEGKPLSVFSSVTLVRGPEGEITDIVSVNRDISERKKFERENRLLANVFINSKTALSVSNHNSGKLERVNKAYEELFGYEEGEMIGMHVRKLYPDKLSEEIQKRVKELELEGFVSFETEMVRKDGSRFDGLVNLSVVQEDLFDTPVRVSTVQDISELKRFQKQLEHERLRFEKAANNVSDVVWEWTPQSNELWWGEGIETVMGYKPEQYERDLEFWKNHIHEDDRERVLRTMNHAEDSGETKWEEEYRFYAADDEVRTVKDSAVLIRDEEGELLRIIGAMVDVTQVLEYQRDLKRERNRFELIARTSNDVLYDLNIESYEVWWSEGWHTRFGYDPADVSESVDWWKERVHPDDEQRILDSVAVATNRGDDYWSGQYRFKNGEGEYRIVTDKGYFIKDENGANISLVGTITDITADEIAKQELKKSEEQYRLLFKQSPIPMYIYDPENLNIVAVNETALDKYGYSEPELLKMKLYELHPKDLHKEIKDEIKRNVRQKRTGYDLWEQITKDGRKIMAEISGSEIYYEGKKRRLVIANDVTEQKKAEERAISAIVEGEERERKRIAKELHDGLGQYLTAANMNFESISDAAETMKDPIPRTFKNGLSLLNYAISETRNISQNLLPKAIQDYGLELGIEALINQMKSNSRINFYFYCNLNGIEIPENIQINLYRVAQETINNAMRHGEPKNINVQLVYSNSEILLTIEDDGKGFLVDEKSETGIGLRSMKTRVGAMSANIDIDSTIGRGTIVSVVVPI